MIWNETSVRKSTDVNHCNKGFIKKYDIMRHHKEHSGHKPYEIRNW